MVITVTADTTNKRITFSTANISTLTDLGITDGTNNSYLQQMVMVTLHLKIV